MTWEVKYLQKNEPRDGSQHKGDQSDRSGHYISIRYHIIYQDKHRVQGKPPQVIHSHLGFLQ